MKKENIRAVCVTAILGAVGFVLMWIEISLPFMPAFIKLDFSELPALITAFAFGPIYGGAVCFIKNLLHLLVTTTGGIGELANFLMGLCFVLPAGIVYKKIKNRKGALLGTVLGAFLMACGSVLINYFLVYPMYAAFIMPESIILGMYKVLMPSLNNLFEALLVFNMPFTFAKGVIVSVICFIVYKKLSLLFKK